MKKATYLCMALIVISSLFPHREALSLDNEKTHRDLSKIAAKQSNLSQNKGNYLINLGFKDELLERLKWKEDAKYVIDWLRDGAKLEDAGSDLDYLQGTARSFNHFHNPIKQWPGAGLKDFYSGESALVWAQDQAYQKQYDKLEGDQTWQIIQDYFYAALTSKPDDVRQAYVARTFIGLGHQIHLIQDMAVPAHVRNDAHPGDAILGSNYLTGDLLFETYAKTRVGLINGLAANAAVPQVDLTKNLVDLYCFLRDVSNINNIC